MDVHHNYATTLQQGLITGGAYSFQFTEDYLRENAPTNNINPSMYPGLSFNFQHSLLQGLGIGVNSRYIREAKIRASGAKDAFRSQLLDLVSNVLNLYWDLVSGNDTVKARQRAVEIAQKFYEDTNNEIRLGVLAGVELPRASAELASRRQELLLAQQTVRQQELQLKDALSREQDPALESAAIIPLDRIEVPAEENLPPLRELVARAMAKRPDVAVAKVNDEIQSLDAIGTVNGLLPTSVGFFSVKDGGADGAGQIVDGTLPNPENVGNLGTALGQIFRRDYPSERIGAYLVIPFRNQFAQAEYGIDQLKLQQSQLSGQRTNNQIVVEISRQLTALRQARARYMAAVNTRTLQEQLLEAEQNRFALGQATITSLIVVQRSLVAAQTSELTALANYQHARISLNQELGETLEANHVSVEESLKERP